MLDHCDEGKKYLDWSIKIYICMHVHEQIYNDNNLGKTKKANNMQSARKNVVKQIIWW